MSKFECEEPPPSYDEVVNRNQTETHLDETCPVDTGETCQQQHLSQQDTVVDTLIQTNVENCGDTTGADHDNNNDSQGITIFIKATKEAMAIFLNPLLLKRSFTSIFQQI